MRFPRKRGSTSVMVRVFIPANNVANGAGLTGLTSASTNLTIAVIRELDAAGTSYTGANIEAQTTVGTFQAPSSSSKIRFKAVDATNFPGVYELQFHDSATAFGTGDASQSITINIYEATTTALNIGPNAVHIPLVPWDQQDGVRMGLTALPNAAPAAIGGLLTAPTTANVGLADLSRILGTALTETAGQIAAGFKKFFNIATPASTMDALTLVGTATNLSSGERTAIANEVEAQIIDDTDSEKVLVAITDKIASVNPSLSGLTLAAIASQVRTELAVELARIDAAISTRLAAAGYISPLDAAAIRAAIGLVAANLDTQIGDLPTNGELATALAAADDATLAQIALVKAKTDSLTFSVVGKVDSNLTHINEVEVTGDGEVGTEWGPA